MPFAVAGSAPFFCGVVGFPAWSLAFFPWFAPPWTWLFYIHLPNYMVSCFVMLAPLFGCGG